MNERISDIAYNEEARLNALRDLNLLDTSPSDSFDRLTRMASRLLDAPVSTIPLTDRDRQWFKSKVGVDLAEIPREQAPCSYAIGDNEIFVWPYFTQVDLTQLTKTQLVELFELVTAGDYQRMVGNGSYDFYRVGLSPEGRFEFFVAGD